MVCKSEAGRAIGSAPVHKHADHEIQKTDLQGRLTKRERFRYGIHRIWAEHPRNSPSPGTERALEFVDSMRVWF